uniref:Uncharacterized protein n=1 Tax=Oryza meridionalis TaxID=40149 RepID=A0A0E0CFR4_9ORYZ
MESVVALGEGQPVTLGSKSPSNVPSSNASETMINVAEGPCSICHPVLRDRLIHRPGNDASEADIADLANEIFVKEDVSRLEITVDKGFRFHLV